MAEATVQVACFRVDRLDCAVDVMRIAEVLGPLPVTRLPAAPRFVEGIVEVRGRFIPVIDLRRRFATDREVERRPGKLLVAPIGGASVALMVDEVMGVERIPTKLVQPAPALDDGRVAPAMVAGVIKWSDRILVLLDIDQVLSRAERAELAEMGGTS